MGRPAARTFGPPAQGLGRPIGPPVCLSQFEGAATQVRDCRFPSPSSKRDVGFVMGLWCEMVFGFWFRGGSVTFVAHGARMERIKRDVGLCRVGWFGILPAFVECEPRRDTGFVVKNGPEPCPIPICCVLTTKGR